jgi:sister-chromatid-cohesion protein PDS5
MDYLKQNRIHVRFFAMLPLVAMDPDREVAEKVLVFLSRQSKLMSRGGTPTAFDMTIVRLIHLLAHHPDFSDDEDELEYFVSYLHLLLKAVLVPNNVSFLFYVVSRLKSAYDAQFEQDKSRNLYILSDIAQHLIQEECTQNSWSLMSFPSEIKLPADMFRMLPSEEANKVWFSLYCDTPYRLPRRRSFPPSLLLGSARAVTCPR